MNESQAMPGPGTYFATNNGENNSLALVAALREDRLSEVTCYNTSDLRNLVWQTNADNQKGIQILTNLINDNNNSILCRLHESEKSSIAAKYESQIAVKDATIKTAEKIDTVDRHINCVERMIVDKFSDLERRIDRHFSDAKERDLQAEINALKADLADSKIASQGKGIVSELMDRLSGKAAKV